MIEVLSVASEVFPLIKTGGLADVTGALPAALAPHGVNMRTLVPGYPAVMAGLSEQAVVATIPDLFDGEAQVLSGRAGTLDLFVLDAPHLYKRPGNPYLGPDGRDWPDNWRRFAALSRVASDIADGLIAGYTPQIVHAHDWQTGLAPVFMRYGTSGARSIMTIHNLAFQGHFGWDIFPQLGLPDAAFAEYLEYFGGVSFLKGGLAAADRLTTVSPTYAREVRTTNFGMGLDGLLEARADQLDGILNGIDTSAWDPMADDALPQGYTAGTLNLREVNRAALARKFELDDAEGPVFAVVSRLTWQKGMDLLLQIVDRLVAQGGRLCVLGTGEPELEAGFKAAAARHQGKVGVIIGFDETLSHLVQGGADVMLVPSRFEPCGLTQLYGLRYGCVPLVSNVGGLADTVIDANEAAVEAGVATGLQFSPPTDYALGEAVRRAIGLFGSSKTWKKMQRRGMKSDVSWQNSAAKYAALYSRLIGISDDTDAD